MSPTDQITAFAQQVYLVIKNRYYDDIGSADGQTYIDQVIDWTNMFLDELETTVDNNGEPVDWKFARQFGYALGTAQAGAASLTLPSAVKEVMADEQRYVTIEQDGTPVSYWAVVAPGSISSIANRITEDMVSQIGSTLVFSRELRDTEQGGSIQGDVTINLPRMTQNSAKILTTIKPKLLLTLGVAKNATLPDIVQGRLAPSYAQKFDALMTAAIARNNSGAIGDVAQRDDYSHIRGIGF